LLTIWSPAGYSWSLLLTLGSVTLERKQRQQQKDATLEVCLLSSPGGAARTTGAIRQAGKQASRQAGKQARQAERDAKADDTAQ